ncbi:DUF4857 domain-containing protein [Arcobacter aquimarinus]|uniref:Membrane protein n=1 Tax=Arcobacter aquimarinus TaxID=1315211 RepID=A0AAE7B207_9BACT|nr:DUF4857 domain-containing protein [Arcobacter aquimarinus]QKE25531.1 putative membrane protein [Arcobacter aquimarinus]RXI33177.1 DUF4857 domain-containing protein [Arcobacter aquimarinus]
MFKSIFLKEWLKIKYPLFFLLIFSIIILSYFAFDLNFQFSTIEPESMMWYRFIHLEHKPHFILYYFYLFVGIIVATSQFLPEIIQKRLKVTLHLPLNIFKNIFLHLFIGIIFICLIITLFSIPLLRIISDYYPKEIVQVVFEDSLFFTLISLLTYIFISLVIMEQNRIKQLLKAVFTLLFLFYFSFQGSFEKEFHKYYIFYSDILDEFIYQKNFGEHRFEYGIKDKKTFSQKEYESYLPFVYYRDLEIQKKLPIQIKDIFYDGNEIKNSKLGFEYNYKMLKKKQVELYPLFNPQSNIGMIKFPEEVFGIFKDGAKVYDFDNDYLKTKSEELNEKLKELNFSYPAKNIWGKTTNIKPFDLGYLIQDNQNRLFNLKKQNDKITLKEINYPKDEEIIHINISENRQQKLSGYAIDKNSNFYLLTWDFEFIKLDLKEFDYKNMRLKLIADPLHYLIRYDNGNSYFAAIFSKENYKKIKEEKWD